MSEFTNVDVPKKAIVAQGIIYQASTNLSVMDAAGIPTVQVETEDVKYDITAGNPGHHDVQFDADSEPSKLAYTPIQARIKWDHRPYMILDGAKLKSREAGRMSADSLRAVADYFAAVRDYEGVTALLAKAGTSTAATDTWDGANADPEGDIVDALKRIKQTSNVRGVPGYSVVLPNGMDMELKKLTLIKNIQRTMQDYLEGSFKIDFYDYMPYKYQKTAGAAVTTVHDALTTSALVFAKGRETALQLQFNPAAAARMGAPMTEHARIPGRGDLYTQKMGYGCLPMWDSLGAYTTSTNYTNFRIQTITGVSS